MEAFPALKLTQLQLRTPKPRSVCSPESSNPPANGVNGALAMPIRSDQ